MYRAGADKGKAGRARPESPQIWRSNEETHSRRMDAVKLLALTQGKSALVDDDDFPVLSRHKWTASKVSQVLEAWYARRNILKSDGIRTSELMHRLISKAQKGEIVDHIDGNGLNNQKSNLRFVNASQNNQNMRRRSDNTSGYKGVWFRSDRRKWSASLQVNGKPISLGCFNDPNLAARAYDNAARKMFGDHARLNNPIVPVYVRKP